MVSCLVKPRRGELETVFLGVVLIQTPVAGLKGRSLFGKLPVQGNIRVFYSYKSRFPELATVVRLVHPDAWKTRLLCPE